MQIILGLGNITCFRYNYEEIKQLYDFLLGSAILVCIFDLFKKNIFVYIFSKNLSKTSKIRNLF